MKKTVIISTLIFFIFFGTAFAQGHHHKSDNFTAEFTELIEMYLEFKNALVESNTKTALSASSHMQGLLEGIGEHRLEGDAHMKWMDHYSKIDTQLTAISASDDLDEIRTRFFDLSEILIESVKTFEIDSVVYHQHCPMAFNFEGGSWLSSEEQIQNPYMPDTMLQCGRVIEKIES